MEEKSVHNLSVTDTVYVSRYELGIITAVEANNDGSKTYTVVYKTPANDYTTMIIRKFNSRSCKYSLDFITKFCTAKVLSYRESGETFGFPTQKSKLVGNTYPITELVEKYVTKKGRETDYISIDIGGKSLKFCKNDIQIIYPNYKGLSLPKDRTIKIGSLLRPKNKFKKSEEYVLSNIVSRDYRKKIVNIIATELFTGKTVVTKLNKFKLKC